MVLMILEVSSLALEISCMERVSCSMEALVALTIWLVSCIRVLA